MSEGLEAKNKDVFTILNKHQNRALYPLRTHRYPCRSDSKPPTCPREAKALEEDPTVKIGLPEMLRVLMMKFSLNSSSWAREEVPLNGMTFSSVQCSSQMRFDPSPLSCESVVDGTSDDLEGGEVHLAVCQILGGEGEYNATQRESDEGPRSYHSEN